jgi:hypothetical protein
VCRKVYSGNSATLGERARLRMLLLQRGLLGGCGAVPGTPIRSRPSRAALPECPPSSVPAGSGGRSRSGLSWRPAAKMGRAARSAPRHAVWPGCLRESALMCVRDALSDGGRRVQVLRLFRLGSGRGRGGFLRGASAPFALEGGSEAFDLSVIAGEAARVPPTGDTPIHRASGLFITKSRAQGEAPGSQLLIRSRQLGRGFTVFRTARR